MLWFSRFIFLENFLGTIESVLSIVERFGRNFRSRLLVPNNQKYCLLGFLSPVRRLPLGLDSQSQECFDCGCMAIHQESECFTFCEVYRSLVGEDVLTRGTDRLIAWWITF
ncbi:hypothetical protein CXB51_016126 [Gossypium anomalum]|uniref:Uncharacterized protein n=1 Tax=Gossypium anomalum TaxID=47600 RepID=A0A8J6D423_9ROSI|nr:hypothetical protein CXB51_016126 [Gossypium anomalum]